MDIVVMSLLNIVVFVLGTIVICVWNYRRKLWFYSIEHCTSNNFEYVITLSNHRGKQFRFQGRDDVWHDVKTGKRPNKKREAYLNKIYTQYNWNNSNHEQN